jgi:hypothetical protein
MYFIRLPLKLLALPLVLAISLLQRLAILLVSISSTIINMLLGIVSLIVISSWMLGLTSEGNVICGLTLCLILFLAPHIAQWCVIRIAVLNSFLKGFIRS